MSSQSSKPQTPWDGDINHEVYLPTRSTPRQRRESLRTPVVIPSFGHWDKQTFPCLEANAWGAMPNDQTLSQVTLNRRKRNTIQIAAPTVAASNIGSRSKRVFPCLELSCDVKPFGSRSDLKRHQREVHHRDEDGNSCLPLPCPIELCERHGKAFQRRWNLQEHLRRVHPDYKPQTLFDEPSSIEEWREMDDRPRRRGSPDSTYSSDSVSTEDSRHGSRDSSCAGLRITLSILEKQRQQLVKKMDQEISKVKFSIAQNQKRKNSE